jgi:hypothetical protein
MYTNGIVRNYNTVYTGLSIIYFLLDIYCGKLFVPIRNFFLLGFIVLPILVRCMYSMHDCWIS